MKKIMTRVLAVLIALAMLASLAACGGDTPNNSSTASQPKSSSTSTDGSSQGEPAENGPLTPMAEPVTVSWGVAASAVQQFKDGDTYEENLWTRLIKERLNIDVEVGFSADSTTDAYNNQMNVRLASGDLPDIMFSYDHTWFYQAQESGYLADITDAYNTYASDEVKMWQELYPGCFNGATIDGRMYAFPMIYDTFYEVTNLWIRDDWLENTNSKAPTTIDELTELMRKFTFEDPDGNGVDDTYGLCLAGDVLQYNYGSLLGLFNAFGVPVHGKDSVFYRGEDGKITFAPLDPACKEALKIANQWYEEGLIDPEFTVKDTSNMESDITTGKYGMSYHAGWGTWHPFNYTYQADGVITRPYPIPKADGYETKLGVSSKETGGLYMINSSCDETKLEAIMKILNLAEAITISGTEDDFKTYWNDEQYRLCPIRVDIPTELWIPVVREALEKNDPSELSGQALQNYNNVVGFEDGTLADDTNAYGAWGQLSLKGSMSIDLDHFNNGEEVENLLGSVQPATWIEKSSVLGDMVIQEFISIIKGETPVEHFDTFVQEWLAAGGQDVLDELEEIHADN